VLRFFRRTPEDLRAFLFAFDVVHVGGGNTRSMLAVWKHWGFDAVVREAWDRGIVLSGSSAGSICWFDAGLTDSDGGSAAADGVPGPLAGQPLPALRRRTGTPSERTSASSARVRSLRVSRATTAPRYGSAGANWWRPFRRARQRARTRSSAVGDAARETPLDTMLL
jgi:hypothetical protein